MRTKKVEKSNIQAPIAARFATAIIIFALFMQAAEIFIRTGSHAWPFTNYPMYATTHYENERLDAGYSVYVIFADGSEHLIDEQDIVGIEWKRSQQQSRRWRPCALSRAGSCVLFHNFLARSIISYPENEYYLNRATLATPSNSKNGNRLHAALKSVVSRRHIASRNIDTFTNTAEINLAKTIVAYRVEDYPAVLTRDGWIEAKPAGVLKELQIKR